MTDDLTYGDDFLDEDAPPAVDAPPAEAPADDQHEDWSDFDPDLVAGIRAAEAAQQRSVCDVPDGDLPDSLAQALKRRVEVNLAQHDGGEIRRVGGKDPEVRELEAPFSRRRAAGSIDHRTQEGQS